MNELLNIFSRFECTFVELLKCKQSDSWVIKLICSNCGRFKFLRPINIYIYLNLAKSLSSADCFCSFYKHVYTAEVCKQNQKIHLLKKFMYQAEDSTKFENASKVWVFCAEPKVQKAWFFCAAPIFREKMVQKREFFVPHHTLQKKNVQIAWVFVLCHLAEKNSSKSVSFFCAVPICKTKNCSKSVSFSCCTNLL